MTVPSRAVRLGPEVAGRAIAVHPRTIQRGLIDEGLTFAEILDCVRRERADALLTGTDLALAGIAARLNLAEPAVLSRCAPPVVGPHRRPLPAGTPLIT